MPRATPPAKDVAAITSKTKDSFEPGRGYTREDWNEVSDNPELTAEQLAAFRPFREVFPELSAKMMRAKQK